MASIIYRVGDVTLAPELLVAHGCNSRGVMGSGVAKAIRDKWPGTYDAYRRVWVEAQKNGRDGLTLGDVIWTAELAEGYSESLPHWVLNTVNADAARIVANCITQKDFGREPGRVYVDYAALARCFDRLDALARLYDLPAIAMPRIGCGLANGSWTIVEGVIHDHITSTSVVVYDIEPIPGTSYEVVA